MFIIFDRFISEIIRDSKTSTEIELFKDGRWSDQTTDESNEDKNIKIGAVVDDCEYFDNIFSNESLIQK